VPHGRCAAHRRFRASTGSPHERPNGSRGIALVDIEAIKDSDGNIVGAVNCFQDVTQRRRADDAALRLAAIVESSDDAIVGTDLEGIITSWNAGAERIFGYTAEEVVGMPTSILIPLITKKRKKRSLSESDAASALNTLKPFDSESVGALSTFP
jgi:PAS domain-containing protein